MGTKIEQLPVWLNKYSLPFDDTKKISRPEFRYSLNLFSEWNTKHKNDQSSGFIEHVYNGKNKTDWLIVTHMGTAIPGHNMVNWVSHYLNTIHFPSVQMKFALEPAPVLVSWNQASPCPDYLEKSGCDEMLGYTANILGGAEKGRLFLLLLRKNNLAWKILLSMKSAWGSGENEVATLYNDHLCASQIFGSLKLNLA